MTRVRQRTHADIGPCYNLNGGCEQICLSTGKSNICECVFGFKLAPNGKSCVSNPVKDNFMLIGDKTHNDIYQISLIDETIQGINAKGLDSMAALIYSPVHDLVIWSTFESQISFVHLNGTGQQILGEYHAIISDINIEESLPCHAKETIQ
ncbi:hypothetical protein CHS0354_040493 [Potamilus streckersoni]|uniref:Vitellogenin receptor n=1 Tax=Potamilus streckersoni TaxID=2493646 RepID=A0AAE0WEL5_9BIVA|nr:hypothetical protein CHS0354_040493 [Potamilus streckersoni]